MKLTGFAKSDNPFSLRPAETGQGVIYTLNLKKHADSRNWGLLKRKWKAYWKFLP
jgi:hypothetical protein